MDAADSADDEIQRAIAEGVKRTRQPGMRPLGACYWCGDTAPPQGLFCSADCRADFEKEQAAKIRNGTKL